MKTELLRRVRKSQNITQESMAKKLGYADKSGYWHLENGNVRITTDVIIEIKKILSLSDKQVKDIFLN